MNPAEVDWQRRAGRDREGDKFDTLVAVHGSGRVLARIQCPVTADEYWYRAFYYCAVPKEILDPSEGYDFMDADSAKRAVEETLGKFNPLAPPAKIAERPKEIA